MGEILIKRIYAFFKKSDGLRILVDRLWPRGIKKENAKIDVWLKEIAPSASLRKWFNHDPENWNEFVKRYKAELKQSQALHELNYFKREHKTITLLYAAHDTEHNNAVVLQRLLNF
jgi:uncharacterized protein YeaO (DUF488 family)